MRLAAIRTAIEVPVLAHADNRDAKPNSRAL
jgi:hypothetical protein